jgi:hypothetical protein
MYHHNYITIITKMDLPLFKLPRVGMERLENYLLLVRTLINERTFTLSTQFLISWFLRMFSMKLSKRDIPLL